MTLHCFSHSALCHYLSPHFTLQDVKIQELTNLSPRFLDADVANSEKFAYIPFGAGRHRCIGEGFAYVQIKTAVSTLLRTYRLELVDGYFPEVDFSTMIHTPKRPIIRYSPRVLV